VSMRPRRPRQGNPAASGHADRCSSRAAVAAPAVALRPDELALVLANLAELAARLKGFGARLAAVEAAIQRSSGSTSRSRRASRSPNWSRSS
jgi:hypothetical protein